MGSEAGAARPPPPGTFCWTIVQFFVSVDVSCYNRCDDPIDPAQPCQCHSACLTNGDCCPDYSDECEGGPGK